MAQNGMISADVKVGKDTVRIVALHLYSMTLQLDALSSQRTLKGIWSVGRENAKRIKTGFINHADEMDILESWIKVSPHPVIVCGDFNVAHKAIDLARPKANYNKSAGYMQEEIDGMDAFVGSGLVDSWRYMNGDDVKYTWWSYRGGAREKNVGWRIDYFLVSEAFVPSLKAATIHNEIMGSDHCPVGLELSL